MAKRNPRNMNDLSRNTYGSGTTIGPRQCAILVDCARLESVGERMTLSYLRFRHPVSAPGSALSALRARGLVKHQRDRVILTSKGREIASSLLSCTTTPGVGLVMSGQSTIRH